MLCKSIAIRNPLATPPLLAALHWLRPCPDPKIIDRLVRAGRVADAAALADLLSLKPIGPDLDIASAWGAAGDDYPSPA